MAAAPLFCTGRVVSPLLIVPEPLSVHGDSALGVEKSKMANLINPKRNQKMPTNKTSTRPHGRPTHSSRTSGSRMLTRSTSPSMRLDTKPSGTPATHSPLTSYPVVLGCAVPDTHAKPSACASAIPSEHVPSPLKSMRYIVYGSKLERPRKRSSWSTRPIVAMIGRIHLCSLVRRACGRRLPRMSRRAVRPNSRRMSTIAATTTAKIATTIASHETTPDPPTELLELSKPRPPPRSLHSPLSLRYEPQAALSEAVQTPSSKSLISTESVRPASLGRGDEEEPALHAQAVTRQAARLEAFGAGGPAHGGAVPNQLLDEATVPLIVVEGSWLVCWLPERLLAVGQGARHGGELELHLV
eukprot:scaffold109065_cov75-Phaeocystis_antarctica.AAC.5